MRNLAWALPIVAFFLNPNLACVDEPEFQFGAAEMRAAIIGDWSFAITPDGGSATELSAYIDQAPAPAAAARGGAGIIRAAYACGTRTLVKPAGACADVSEMPLLLLWWSGDAFATAPLSGTFRVHGLAFGTGDLELTLGAYRVAARVSADGAVTDARLVSPGPAGTVAITRL